jgi:hypothetical protein
MGLLGYFAASARGAVKAKAAVASKAKIARNHFFLFISDPPY